MSVMVSDCGTPEAFPAAVGSAESECAPDVASDAAGAC